ncbi:hypothetical protein [Actinoplanes couchii]|uniref:Uncharacterized protein n=1 Tax=Actinoplanes couchii TaxID=403638 RepID=A0ABQ3XDI0_9ACTN|nr:hypothetical protein [Actinoplanes couchii]MDR6317061.1 hypothetical protein [Actinoplanes couchii]GID56556.1 hypothetical protein Aco03nite_049600 [Actinoplanes couchii]
MPEMSPPSDPAAIGHWITSAPMRALVAAFGGELPELPTGKLLIWLDEFSARHWDFRAGAERFEARDWTGSAAESALIMDAARALGLVVPQPPRRDSYDHLLVLGGLAQGCLQRAAYAARLVSDGLKVGAVAALGSFRPCGPAERALLAKQTDCHEVDALDQGVRDAFGLTASAATRTGSDGPVGPRSWSHHIYRLDGGPRVHVLAAPASGHRANTADTYEFWAEELSLGIGATVLIVTTPIYVPFQHCDAVRILGCDVETIGLDQALLPAAMRQEPFSAGRHLQEVRSAIRSMHRLYDATI